MALTDFDSIAKRLILAEAGGPFIRTIWDTKAATTAANTTSGYISAARYPAVVTMPSLTGYTGFEMEADIVSSTADLCIVGIEYDLGVLTISGNSFAAGADSSMPTKDTRIEGTTYSARQTGSCIPMLVATAALTATTPTITTTYVNEDGTGSRTCSMTLPTNATVNTAFLMLPHLNSGDTGVQDVTNMSTSAGSAGTLAVKGLLPIGVSIGGNTTTRRMFPWINRPIAPILAVSGDEIACYRFGATAAIDVLYTLYGRPI